MSIAWEHLEPIERYYIVKFYPPLRPTGKPCKKCGGNIIDNHGEPICLQCGAEHNQDGELMPNYGCVKVTKEQMSKDGIDNRY